MDALLLRSLSHRGRLAVRGPDRQRFLHGMVSNDIKALAPSRGCAAVLLTIKGKLVADLTIYDCDVPDQELLLEMEGSVRARVLADLERHLIMDDAEIVDRSAELDELGIYAATATPLLGGGSEALARALTEVLRPQVALPTAEFAHCYLGESGLRVAATRELGIAGFRLFAPPAVLAAARERLLAGGARLLPDEEAEVLRVEAGVPRYGQDMDEDRLPIEANLDHAVSFTKGCYLGQEPIARVAARGHVNRRLRGLRLVLPAGAPVPARGTALHHESRADAGVVTSVVTSPRHGTIALGYVHRTVFEPGTRLQVAGGGEAEVTLLPFGHA